jgi:signal peptidase I
MEKIKSKNKWKNFFKKFWWIVWKDESLKGWLISIVFIFILIKFVFFPGLSLVTGTELPLAIVESCSMYHQGNLIGNYDSWWENHENKYLKLEINNEKFKEFNFKKGFSKGDILFIIKAKPEKLKIGDVIIFNAGIKNPIIHRVVGIKQENETYIFSTMGDNNNGQLSIEKEINQEQLVGKAFFRITPSLGWGKLIFYESVRPESERGFCDEK